MDKTRRRIRAWHVHTLAFVVVSALLITIDLAGTAEEGAATFLGLEWAHILILIWFPILAAHVLLTWWDSRFSGLKDVVEVPFAPHRSKRL